MPELRLLDARDAGLDEAGLRAMARELTQAAGARHTTRSYRFPWALVAWHERPVGVDLERIAPATRSFAESIATPDERAELTGLAARSEARVAAPSAAELAGRPDLDGWVADLWCSKEALAKALGDAVRYDPRRLEAPMRWSGLRSGPWQATPVEQVPPFHVGWLCWR